MITPKERFEIEQDLLTKTKDELVQTCLELIDSLEESTDQTRRALIQSGALKLS